MIFGKVWRRIRQTRVYAFAKPVADMHKIVFSKELKKSEWKNTEIARGDYVKFITQLKKRAGKDIICYGGSTFISSLIEVELIDEFHLIINPAVIGDGLPIFQNITRRQDLRLNKAIGFECGVAVLQYQLNRNKSKS
jgi:dihydrofolate reductase